MASDRGTHCTGQDTQFLTRPAERKDCLEIRRLVQELADFEKMPDGPQITASILEKCGFETDPPLFECFVAEEVYKLNKEPPKIVGYALYYYAFSSWNGRKLNLDDIYVSENYRRKGVGALLFKEVAKKTVEQGCVYMEFTMLSWNLPAEAFYNALGCINLTTTLERNLLRLEGKALQNVIKSGSLE